MDKYEIKIELLSETILGSGESVAGYVDLDILHDELGLPFFKGKTLKGRLREEAENIVRLQSNIFSQSQVDFLFGKVDGKQDTVLAFSNCTVSSNIQKAIKTSNLSSIDILNSLTDIRSFTSIGNNGVAEEGTLRQIRVINKGLKLFSEVSLRKDISKEDLLLIGLSVLALKHIGLMCSRGKGNIKCTFLENGIDITDKLLEQLREKVK